MDEKVKVLISGDVRGNFTYLFNKVKTVNDKSGPFEALFCCGEFFGDNNSELDLYKTNSKTIPLPTFILGPCKPKYSKYFENLENGIICSNLTYLGKRGLYTLVSGLKVAYLSGIEQTKKQNDTDLVHFDDNDVIALRNSCLVSKGSLSDYRGVDILLTSQWPKGINDKFDNTSRLISHLVREIRPRYHFAALNGIFCEPSIFRIPADNVTSLNLPSRFIALGSVSKASKEKFLHGLTLTSVNRMRASELIQKTINDVECPYEKSNIFGGTQTSTSNSQYFYDLNTFNEEQSSSSGGSGRKRNSDHENSFRKRQRNFNNSETCWFCLSSPNVEKHLIISVGTYFYLTLAKGPINETHVLILPIKHIQKVSLLSKDEWIELKLYKKSLKDFFLHRNEAVCFFERNYKTSHLQINAIAIDIDLEWKIKHTIQDKCEEHEVKLQQISKINDPSELPEQGPYFTIELPDDTTYLGVQMNNFPLHFARDIFCSENLLNCYEKVDWKQCNLSQDEEQHLVKEFRKSYEPYDFTAS